MDTLAQTQKDTQKYQTLLMIESMKSEYDDEKFKYLLNKCENIDIVDQFNRSLLHYSCYNGHLESVKLLNF